MALIKVTKKGRIYVNSHFVDGMAEMLSIVAKELYENKVDVDTSVTFLKDVSNCILEEAVNKIVQQAMEEVEENIENES